MVFADGPTDNLPDKVRRIPPPGVVPSAAERSELEHGVSDLTQVIDALRRELSSKPALLDLLPDVQIFQKAVQNALAFDEFFNITNEVPAARDMLRQGTDRANHTAGKARTAATDGRGGYLEIDGSVNHGLVCRLLPAKRHHWVGYVVSRTRETLVN
jgi:hypothetical protein